MAVDLAGITGFPPPAPGDLAAACPSTQNGSSAMPETSFPQNESSGGQHNPSIASSHTPSSESDALPATANEPGMLKSTSMLDMQSNPNLRSTEESSTEHISAPTQSRVEALLEQQNMLMLRHLELSEESCKVQRESVLCQYKSPTEFLKGLDPCFRAVFADWRKEFCKKMSLYVDQSRLSTKYQVVLGKGELMTPFLHEAKKSWDWPQFYRSRARLIDSVDCISPDDLTAGAVNSEVNSQDAIHGSAHTDTAYDIDYAFLELRRKHAQELQNFVIAHQKICFEEVSAEIALPNQVLVLEATLEESMSKHAAAYNLQAKQLMKKKAKRFVELVHRDEMAKAEIKLQEDRIPSCMLATMMRIGFLVAVLVALTTMSHELLTRLFAVIFALVCGMALLWEDFVVSSLHLLCGETVRRLRLLGVMPQHGRSLTRTTAGLDMCSLLPAGESE